MSERNTTTIGIDYLLQSYYNKLLSGKTLYELADVLFFALPCEHYLSKLGINYLYENIMATVNQFKNDRSKSVLNKKIAKSIKFDFDLPQKEHAIIAEQIRILFEDRLSGLNDFRNLKQQLFVIFAIVQRRTGNSNGVLKLLEIMLAEIKNKQQESPNMTTHYSVIQNTIKYHINNEQNLSPLVWKSDEELKINTIMSKIKNKIYGEENERGEKIYD